MVANDLSSLVQGLSSYDNIELHARSTPSKDERVAQTRDLRIVGFGPTGRLVIKLRDILAAGDWTTVGLTPRQGLTKSRQLALSAFDKMFQSVRQADTDLLEVPPFKSLRNLVLGQRHDRGWDFLKDISPNDLQVHQTQVGVFLYSHQPRSICLHATHGPYSGQMHHLVYDPNTHAATITRHLYDFDTDCPQIFCGARNRWMFYPGVVTRWRTDSEDQHRAEVFTEDLVRALTQRVNFDYRPLVRDGEEEWVEPKFGTTIDIYGLGMHAGARSHLLQQDDILDDPPEETEPDPDRKEVFDKLKGQIARLKAELQDGEDDMNKWYIDALASCGEDWDKWSDKVKLRPWREVPACACCGWTTEAVIEEFDEGLSKIPSMIKLLRARGTW